MELVTQFTHLFICIFKRCKYIHYHLHNTIHPAIVATLYIHLKYYIIKILLYKIHILMEKFRQGHKPNFTREKISNIIITVLLSSWYANK
jgi:hypothetical protein